MNNLNPAQLASYHGPLIDNGLVAYFPLQENTGINVHDIGPNNINGTLINSPQWNQVNNRIALSLVYASQQQVSCSLQPLTTSNSSFSLCFWFYTSQLPESFSSDYGIISGMNSGQTAGYYVGIDDSSNQYYFLVDGGYSESTTALTTNKWYHICATAQAGPPYTINIYTNGVLETPSSQAGTNTYTVQSSLVMGYDSANNSYMTGLLQDIRIYNRVLSQTEITQIYNFQG